MSDVFNSPSEPTVTSDGPSLARRIHEAALVEFAEKGASFTMDDLCWRLGISKKTLYKTIPDKQALVVAVIDDAWVSIKAQEAALVADTSLDVVEKFQRVVALMPALGTTIDYRQIRVLEQTYPAVRRRIEDHLNADWDVTLALYHEAVAQGRFRRVDPSLLREVLLASMDRLLADRFLEVSGRTYQDSMEAIVELLVQGLRT